MAVREVWFGSFGPFLYDDTDTYPDGTAKQGVYAETMKVTTAPTSADDVARKDDVDGVIVDPASTVEDETTFGIAPAVGTSEDYARADHTHGTPANPVSGATGTFTSADGKTVTVTNGLVTSIV